MTAAELIEILQHQPPDQVIQVYLQDQVTLQGYAFPISSASDGLISFDTPEDLLVEVFSREDD